MNEVQQVAALSVKFQDREETLFIPAAEISELAVGDYVFVKRSETNRDIGRVLWIGRAEPAGEGTLGFVFVRKATASEQELAEENIQHSEAALQVVRKLARDQGLEMKVIKVSFAFDEALATIYYTAPARVDFRNLVKSLAKELKARILMKQISAKEEARLLGGIGPYGPHSWWSVDRAKS